jgi:hypothetical protein
MKTKLIYITFIFSAICISSFSQTTFQKVLGGAGEIDYLKSVKPTPDGGYIACGSTNSFGVGGVDILLIKLNSSFQNQWLKTFGSINFDDSYSVAVTSDSGYVITGYTSGLGSGGTDAFLIRTDKNGNVLWNKFFGGTNNDYGNSVLQTSDDGFIIAGSTSSYGAGLSDGYIIKTDSIGNVMWTKTYGGVNNDEFKYIEQISDTTYILCGSTNTPSDVYVVKINSLGNSIWTRTIGGSGIDSGNTIHQTPEHNFIISGYTYSYGFGLNDSYLIKLDSIGNLIWTKTFGGSGNDLAMDAITINNNSYIFLAQTGSYGSGGKDAWLIKTDTSGNLLWTKTYGSALNDYEFSILMTADNGYLMVGATHSWAAGSYGGVEDEIYLVKTDSLGNSGCFETTPTIQQSFGGNIGSVGIVGSGNMQGTGEFISLDINMDTLFNCLKTSIDAIASDNKEFLIYPNPTNQNATLEFNNPTQKNCTFILYDLRGKVLRTIDNIKADKFEIESQSLANGIYFFQVCTDRQILASGKLTIE